ncbi:MAG: ABC transporter permease [Spirochaetia bacterium]|nr:ABC transporter permease [Spirochaetia bacterium]MCF7946731.1 ABC transporter permease [Spirochaetia bacterium]MCF7952907.1 ABC transporter permease [Spirochaetales bacterium]
MLRYLLSRIISLLITLFIIITLTFFLMHAIPGGPYDFEEQDLNPEIIKILEQKYNLDDPVWRQYVDYLKGIVTFDLGPSFFYEGRSVTELINQGFPITSRLAILSILFVIIASVPMGIIAAVRRNRFADRLVMFISTLGRTIPSFVMATVFIYFLSYKLGWFPIYGADSFMHYILPALALSLATIGRLTRLNRAAMLDVINQDYIRTAYAKGLSPSKVMLKHALKNASIPMITVLGARVATLLTGSFVIERIFAMPGIGRYFIQSISNRDYPTIMGITIYYSIILLVSMLVVDIIYGWIDPRVRVQSKGSTR